MKSQPRQINFSFLLGFFRKALSASISLILPTFIAYLPLQAFGHKISPRSRIGFSWLWCERIFLEDGAKIGHLNLLAVRRLVMRRGSYFGRMNVVSGPFSVILKTEAALGNANKVLRAKAGVTTGSALLFLGKTTKITSKHTLDCTCSIHIGEYSIIAGYASQLWTHGYIHEASGIGRYRIDGRIDIANNVYIGSACVINLGVYIGPAVIVGSGTVISKSLPDSGMYVSSSLRTLPRPHSPVEREDLILRDEPHLIETVYLKKRF
jgi:acetyltransferase-like isoleucine patch superfamily enzyme